MTTRLHRFKYECNFPPLCLLYFMLKEVQDPGHVLYVNRADLKSRLSYCDVTHWCVDYCFETYIWHLAVSIFGTRSAKYKQTLAFLVSYPRSYITFKTLKLLRMMKLQNKTYQFSRTIV